MKIGFDEYLISIVLTVYNRKDLIFRAIESIENQTYKNFEVIIVDDGSTDEIERMLIAFIKNKNNYKYLRHSNRRSAYSLNSGILVSSGKFITFLDSDDEYKPDHLEMRIEFFNSNKDIDLICSTATLVGDEKDFFVPDVNDVNKSIHINDCIIGATLFGKNDVFKKLEGFKDMYSYDSEFYQRAIQNNLKVKKLDLPTYIYHRDNPDSVINNFRDKINK